MASKLSEQEFKRSLAEARKDPQFHTDIRKFIKITTGTYKLKDYGLENSFRDEERKNYGRSP